MSLNLDARQRAMLDEMHIPYWWPEPPVVGELLVRAPEQAPVQTPTLVPTLVPTLAPQRMSATAPPTAVAPAAAPQAPAAPPPVARPAPAAPGRAVAGAASTWRLLPAQALYASPAAPGGWLVVTEAIWPGDDPLADDGGPAARLLDNMLRAMGLHKTPQVWAAGLARRAADEAPEPLAWADLLQARQPQRVLLMGRTAAREALGTDEPLGRLRGRLHDLHGVPAVVTYDAPYLLRAQADKARAWADLCLALG
jgi:uracil-DNA glycosylase